MHTPVSATSWPLWRKVVFRFFFIYFTLHMSPWGWIDLPGINLLIDQYYNFTSFLVYSANDMFFHVRKELVPINGSGDTSFAWAQLQLFLWLSLIGCLIWSIIDGKRPSYNQADYWLRTFIRYFIILVCISYGASKVFMQQMPYPSLSQMATPLGDLLPMRFSWLFIGYSGKYQIFCGLMEVLAGLLLLSRRTITLGLIVATGVFLNVAMFNISYDIPVKLYAINYVFCCLYLLAYEYKRLAAFFIQNKPAPVNDLYNYRFSKRWMRISKMAMKTVFVLCLVIVPFIQSYSEYAERSITQPLIPFDGIYDVSLFVRNNDTLTTNNDSLRWRDIIFENSYQGSSIGTRDTAFRQRYGRGYFNCEADSAKSVLHLTKTLADGNTVDIANMRFETKDGHHIKLWTVLNGDSLYIEAKKVNRHYQLAENQFHWISEYNR